MASAAKALSSLLLHLNDPELSEEAQRAVRASTVVERLAKLLPDKRSLLLPNFSSLPPHPKLARSPDILDPTSSPLIVLSFNNMGTLRIAAKREERRLPSWITQAVNTYEFEFDIDVPVPSFDRSQRNQLLRYLTLFNISEDAYFRRLRADTRRRRGIRT
jgi:hypothetical protein